MNHFLKTGFLLDSLYDSKINKKNSIYPYKKKYKKIYTYSFFVQCHLKVSNTKEKKRRFFCEIIMHFSFQFINTKITLVQYNHICRSSLVLNLKK